MFNLVHNDSDICNGIVANFGTNLEASVNIARKFVCLLTFMYKQVKGENIMEH
jgi:hypothetical protein